jgi:hypothetical protein
MTKIALGRTPAGQVFIRRVLAAIADMALAFAGEPDEKVRAHLEQGREDFTAKLAEQLGVETAAAIVDAMFKAVIGRKRELEAKGGGNA